MSTELIGGKNKPSSPLFSTQNRYLEDVLEKRLRVGPGLNMMTFYTRSLLIEK